MESLLEKHPSARAFLKSRRGGGDEDDSSPRPVQELESQITYLAVEAYRREAITADRLKDISEKLGRARRELFELAQAALDD
jgi:hypothetical protein